MGKKGKKADDEKKAALQARKEAKADKAARKKLAKQSGNDVLAATEDEELDKVLQAYKSQDKAYNVEKATLQDIETEFPLPRANATLVSCVDEKKDFFYLFGGEYYDGIENVLLDDLLRLDVAKQEWKMVITSPRPPPRCAHSCVSYKQSLYVFGGELATASEYHHYRDLWKFDLKTLKWTEIMARNGPSARSGHACFLWKSYMIVFGGFFEAARETKFFADLHVFNLQTEQWMDLPTSRLSTKPEPRSACNFGIFGDKALIHGGFTKLKTVTSTTETKVHTDAWVLNLAPLQQQKAPTWERWISSTKGNTEPRPPNGRAGTSSVTYKNRLLVFGGVRDFEQLHHKMDSIFYNDLVALDVERRKWFPLRVKEKAQAGKRRRRKPKEDGTEDEENVVEGGEESSSDIEEDEEEEGDANDQAGWDIDMLRANMFAFVDGDGNIVYEKIEDPDTKVDPIEEKEEEKEEEEDDEEKEEEEEEEEGKEEEKGEEKEEEPKSVLMTHKKIASSSVMVLNPETQVPEAVERTEPLPRINPSLLVHGNIMYLMGGILEVGDREITLDDFWALDLRKREKWQCVWKGTMHNQVWRGAIHDDDDSYISTGREDGDSDEDDDFVSSEEDDEMMQSPDDKKSKKNKRAGLKEEIAELNAKHNLDDENRTPNPNEGLADFYSRTSEYWNGQAAAVVSNTGEQLSNKELKREGFSLAKERFDELKSVLDRLMELSLERKAGKEEQKSKDEKKKDKKSKRKEER